MLYKPTERITNRIFDALAKYCGIYELNLQKRNNFIAAQCQGSHVCIECCVNGTRLSGKFYNTDGRFYFGTSFYRVGDKVLVEALNAELAVIYADHIANSFPGNLLR